jgi:hypothetical protein
MQRTRRRNNQTSGTCQPSSSSAAAEAGCGSDYDAVVTGTIKPMLELNSLATDKLVVS